MQGSGVSPCAKFFFDPESFPPVSWEFRVEGDFGIAGMSIVPSSDELIIEAHVTQLDRKAVHSGLEAQIHLSAYSSRVVPKIPGTVRTVSADRLVDDTTHQPYYLARVAVDRQPKTLSANRRSYSGHACGSSHRH
jgi:hypothetical protein